MNGVLFDKSRVEIKLGGYGVASATALSDPGVLPKVQEYRRVSSARMQPLDRDGITERIPTADYHVSRKVDGEFTVLAYRGGEAYSINPGGTVRIGLPWLEEAEKRLTKAGVKEAMIAGELYAWRDEARRPRVHDVAAVARTPQSAEELNQLRFAAFDILSIDGATVAQPFAETWKTIQRWFGSGERVHPVEAKAAQTATEIQKIFDQWVVGEGAEGIVVRSDTAGLFKVKPRHTLDVAVIGFTESQAERLGMLHDLLTAVMRSDGTLQVLGRVGGGFTDDQRRTMLSDLKDMVVESEYAEVNSDHVAYQMVNPRWVIEMSCLDLISQTTRGGAVNRMVLDFKSNGSDEYHVVTRLPLATVISPQFVRRREDKTVRPQDVRIAQVTDVVEVPLAERDARQMTLPMSELLHREVFTKELKGQMMVRKFVMWQTNKATDSDEFPAYVVHYTDFSPNRKDALAREVRVSSSAEQIEQLYAALKAENIKAGWAPAKAADAVAPTAAVVKTEESVAAPEGEMAPSKRARAPRKKKSG